MLNLDYVGAGERGDKVVSYSNEKETPRIGWVEPEDIKEVPEALSSLGIGTQRERDSKRQVSQPVDTH